MDRVIAAAEARNDYNNEAEKKDTLAYLHAARAVFVSKSRTGSSRKERTERD